MHVHMPAHKVMMTAKHKMGSAAVRSFLASMWKMGNGQKNWEEEGKSLVKKNKVDRKTKRGGLLKLETVEGKENSVEDEEEAKKGRNQRKAQEILMLRSHRYAWLLCANFQVPF